MLDPFQLPFMRQAALEIALLAPLAGILGTQIVLRRLAFLTHGLGAAAFPGLVIAGPAGIPPAAAAFGASGGFAVLLERLSRRRGVAFDAATALVLCGALAIGIVLASDVFESGAGVDQLLFGSLLAIGDDELRATVAALAFALLAAALARRTWVASGFDPAGGRALGLRVVAADWLLIAALTGAVVASLDAVGALLVSAVFVIPAATVRLFANRVVALEAGATVLALVQGLVGLRLAYELDTPPGATVATFGGALFLVCLAARTLATRTPRSAS